MESDTVAPRGGLKTVFFFFFTSKDKLISEEASLQA